MGVIQLPDELQQVIEREVAEGRAISPAAFLQEAVMRLVDASRAAWSSSPRVYFPGSTNGMT